MIGSKDFKPTGKPRIDLSTIAEHEEKEVTFRCWVQNARVQSAKLAFLNLRQGLTTVQAVVAASEKISKQMVKFCGSLNTETTLAVTGLVKRVKEPIKSATVKDFELHITAAFVEAKADILPLQVDDAERPLPSEGLGDQDEQQTEGDARPLVGLNTRLNNRTLDLRATINHAIFIIKSGVCQLFQEFLSQKGYVRRGQRCYPQLRHAVLFRMLAHSPPRMRWTCTNMYPTFSFVLIHTPKILGAASEGGANVFEVKYFDRPAYLAQSPQFYKQMLISSRYEKVMEIGPVFRAENSNTARHVCDLWSPSVDILLTYNSYD